MPILFIEPEKRPFHANEYEDIDDLDVEAQDTDAFGGEPYPDRAVLSCGHEPHDGRCEHMDEFQPTLTFVQYGTGKA